MIQVPLVRRLKFYAKHGRRLWSESFGRDPAMPATERARHIVRGFDPLEGSWYDQAGVDKTLCLSNAHRETLLHGLNGHRAVFLDSKLAFAHAMAGAGLPHPALFGHSHRGRWHWLGAGEAGFAASIAANGRGVLKPDYGKKGQSILFVDRWTPGTPPPRDELMATEFVRQADYAAAIFPGSLNTIRLVTVNPEGTDPAVVAAVHRFGAASTGGVDNFSAGGVVARLDLETGRMDRAFRIGPGNRLDWLERHPDSGQAITGTVVPGWADVLALVHALCARLPFLPYVGWDIAVTPDGPMVIEGNAHPSLRFFQVYGPLMADPATAARFRALVRARIGGPVIG